MLPANSNGRELKFEIYSPFNRYINSMPDIGYAKRGDAVSGYIYKAAFTTVGVFILIIGGLILVSFHIFFLIGDKIQLRRSSNKTPAPYLSKNNRSKQTLYVGGFTLLASLWFLVQSGALQLFFAYPQISYLVEILTMVLAPIPLNLLILEKCRSQAARVLSVFVWLYTIAAALIVVFQLSSLVEAIYFVVPTHIALLVNIIFLMWVVAYEYFKYSNKKITVAALPVLIISISAIGELADYYLNNMYSSGAFVRVGIILYIIFVFIFETHAYIERMMSMKETEYLEYLAQYDLLTGLKNRNSYERALTEHKKGAYSAVLFDLNRLKYINDNFGHAAGDEALKNTSMCIAQSFLQDCEIYRIGGDEFAVLAPRQDDFTVEAENFTQCTSQKATELEYPFSIAYGVANYDSSIDKNIYETVKRADAAMYEMKLHQSGIRTE